MPLRSSMAAAKMQQGASRDGCNGIWHILLLLATQKQQYEYQNITAISWE
jgi:hypothetical protein